MTLKVFSILIILFCQSVLTYSQSSKMRLGFKLLPGIADASLSREPQPYLNINPRLTFSFGGQFIYSIKDSLLYLESGIQFCDKGSLQKDFVSSYSTSSGSFTKTSDIYIHSYYYSIPLLLRIEKSHFYASAGVSADIYSHTKWLYTPEENKIERSNWRADGFSNTVKLGAQINVGIQMSLGEKTQLFIEGGFSNCWVSKNPFSNEYSYFFNYSLGTGLSFKLK
jgi:hypothetical protein